MAQVTPFMDALVSQLAAVFPELAGRIFAVTEIDIDEAQIKELALPIMLVSKPGDQAAGQDRGGTVFLTDDVTIAIFDRTERGAALPRDPSCGPVTVPTTQLATYSYRDDTAILNRVRNMVRQWQTPQGGRVRYVASRNDSDAYAYTLEIDLAHIYQWCEDETPSCEPLFFVDAAPR